MDSPRQRLSNGSSGRSTTADPDFQEKLEVLIERLQGADQVEGLHPSDAAFLFASLHASRRIPLLWICRSNREAEETADNLRFFLGPQASDQVLVLPGSEADPYRGLSPHPEIAERRALGLWRLLQGFRGILVSTVVSLATRIPSPSSFLSHSLHLEVGAFVPMEHLLGKLHETGFVREDPVTQVGEYSVRGGIVDFFSPTLERPVRVEFFGDEVESIREFDPATQRSTGLVTEVQLVPMREMVVTAHEIALWQEKAPSRWSDVRFAEALSEAFQFTKNGEVFNGFEYLFPLVLETRHSLFDIFAPEEGPEPRVILSGRGVLFGELDLFLERTRESFRDRWEDGELCLSPEELLFGRAWLESELARRGFHALEEVNLEGGPGLRFDFLRAGRYQGRIQELLRDLAEWSSRGERTMVVMQSQGLSDRIVDLLGGYDVEVQQASEGFLPAVRYPLSVTRGKLRQGFHSRHLGLHLLTEDNLFGGDGTKTAPRKSSPSEVPGVFVSDFRDLKPGDFVVHVEHGIGVFRGLKRIGVGEDVREFVELSYRDDNKLYVPVDRLDLLQKYSSSGQSSPAVDRLGGASWHKTKSRIKKSMRDLAEDLLKLYARRETVEGHAFSPDDALMKEFEEAFQYEETPDQRVAIQDVKRDLEQSRPMDRLICGDVGYGKTEVAMRGSFKAVSDGKQVVVLAPTTVLALQHFNTFQERFRGFPVHIELLSRFRDRKQQKETLERTSKGFVDILIGTHRLLSRDVRFKDLGLMVVDEEQRFGVAQKERLKALKTRVDVLTLSATPIPRTLNMSLIGLRDLSIIETPPKDRLAIQTVVVRFSRQIIRSAIDLELKREGQVFFLHNSVETIYSIAKMIRDLVPEARVAVAHGRMPEQQLEQVMFDFLSHQYDVLVCTTIIENGLDIPRANTLIVNRADRFGLSQLYQLRGRVGRSSRRAYAYLLVSSEETLTEDARKRLAAIREFSELGAGFRIAALDLEIRGAGNLLGGEQHGHINAVGLELYLKLLQETIREIKGEEVVEDVQTSIDLKLDIQIPEHYVEDANQRLWLYKRISAAENEQRLGELQEETVDRFGRYPKPVANLFDYARLRLKARPLRIHSIDRKTSRVFLKFREDTPVSPERIIRLVESGSGFHLSPDGTLSVDVEAAAPGLFGFLQRLFESLDVVK